MNKAIVFIALVLIINVTHADELPQTEPQQAKLIQRQLRVKKALQVLIDEGIFVDNDHPLNVEPSFLDQLRANGTIKTSKENMTSVICVIPLP